MLQATPTLMTFWQSIHSIPIINDFDSSDTYFQIWNYIHVNFPQNMNNSANNPFIALELRALRGCDRWIAARRGLA